MIMNVWEMKIVTMAYVVADTEEEARKLHSQVASEELGEIDLRRVRSMAEVVWDREAEPYGRNEGLNLGQILETRVTFDVPREDFAEIVALVTARGGRVAR